MLRYWTHGLGIVALAAASALPAGTPASPTPAEIVDAEVAPAGGLARQAEVLARLAWFHDDLEVAAEARRRLTDYREHGLAAIGSVFLEAEPSRQTDLLEALMETSKKTTGATSSYLPTLATAVWFGTREAREIAIPELGRRRYRPALLPIIDAAIEDPHLLPIAVAALGSMRSPHGRFFLEEVMRNDEAGLREAAAVALARCGDEARLPLKEAMRSDDPDLRATAVRAILPFAEVGDLSALYEYVSTHANDDPKTVQAVWQTAAALEKKLEDMVAGEAASPPDE